MRVFFSLVTLITMIKEVFYDIIPFSILFMFAITIFTFLILFVKQNEGTMGKIFEADDCDDPEREGINQVMTSTLLLIIGEKYNEENAYGFFLYILMLMAFVIVMLNLLIAIV